MRILFFTQHFWPENFRINEVVKFFSKKDHDIKVLTCDPSYPSKIKFKNFYDNNKKYKYYGSVEVLRVPIIARKFTNLSIVLNYITFLVSSFFLGFYKIFFKKFDIIFIFSTSPILSAIPAILIKKILRKKIVIWVLDLWPNTIIDLGFIKNKLVIKIMKKLVKFIYDNSNLIVVQSHSFKKEIKKITKTECFYISSWPEEIAASKKKIRSKKIKELKVLFAGNIGEAQSFESMIECAKILKGKGLVKWVIVGDGRWKSKLKNLIKDNDLKEDFQLFNSVPLSEMTSIFDYADVLFLSLKNKEIYKKTIPGKLYTYMSTGKPILGMISGEANKIIKKSNCGFVCEADDFQALKDNIIKFNKLNKHDIKILGDNGKSYANKNFNKLKILNDIEKKLLEL